MSRLLLAVAIPLLAACARQRPAPGADQVAQAAAARARYDSAASAMAVSVRAIAAPLAALDSTQQASVAALLVLAHAAAASDVRGVSSSPSASAPLWAIIPEICPPLRSYVFARGGCLDAQVAYVSSLASCRREGKSDDECERNASPELAALMACELAQLDQLAGIIGRLGGRRWPPGPFPWPIEGVPAGGRRRG